MAGWSEQALAARLEAQGLTALDATTSIDFMIEAVSSERPDIAAHAAPDGQVTILFSDIENSTLMTERLGDERWLEVLRAHNALFRRHRRPRTAAIEVKNQGDGFMLVFADSRRAVECAVAIQRELAERDLVEGERVRVRMGMHAGEAIREEGDFFGRSVILAARIAAQAAGGEILVSEDAQAARRGTATASRGRVGFDAAASSSSRAWPAPTASTARTGSRRSPRTLRRGAGPQRERSRSASGPGCRPCIVSLLLVGHPASRRSRDHPLGDDPDVPVLGHPGGEQLLDDLGREPVDRRAGVRREEDPLGVAALEQRERRSGSRWS